MSLRDETVYGERVRDLLPGLLAFRDAAVYDDRGGFQSAVTLEPEVAQPLFRAMMRVEAELLLEDADNLGSDAHEDRTHEQRAADALVRLAVRIGEKAGRR
jgi:hypothetical protein